MNWTDSSALTSYVNVSNDSKSMRARFKMLIISAALVALNASSFAADVFFVEMKVNGTNILKEYRSTLKSGELPSDFHERLKGFKILLVSGIFSNKIRDLQEVPGLKKLGGYFDDQMAWLKENEVDFQLVEINSEETSVKNAAIIRTAIDKSEKPIIILAHSKGSLDTLEALLRGKEEHRKKAKGWISIGAPFQGTPLADAFLKYPAIKFLTQKVLEGLGGSLGAVESMTLPSRAKYMEENAEEIKNISEALPIISMANWKKNKKNKIDSSLEPLRNYIDDLGYQNDGAVPWKSGVYPGSSYISLEGVDHLTVIKEDPVSSYDRKAMTQTLFILLLKRIKL